MRRLLLTLRHAALSTYADGLLEIAKGAAFSALLGFFPVLTTLATVLVQANAQWVSRTISNFLFEVVPPGTEDLVQYAFTAKGARPNALIALAALLSIWAASDVVVSLMTGFQAAYGTTNTRGFWQQRWIAVLLVFSTILPAIGASVLLVFGEAIEFVILRAAGLLGQETQLQGVVAFVGRSATIVLAMGALTLATSWLYRFAPSRPRGWKRVWPGAFVATVLGSFATLAFGWYVRNIATYNIMYGSIGAAIAMLVWLYLLSLIALFGCAFNAQAERLRREGLLS